MADTVQRWTAGVQTPPLAARRAFPCGDFFVEQQFVDLVLAHRDRGSQPPHFVLVAEQPEANSPPGY